PFAKVQMSDRLNIDHLEHLLSSLTTKLLLELRVMDWVLGVVPFLGITARSTVPCLASIYTFCEPPTSGQRPRCGRLGPFDGAGRLSEKFPPEAAEHLTTKWMIFPRKVSGQNTPRRHASRTRPGRCPPGPPPM